MSMIEHSGMRDSRGRRSPEEVAAVIAQLSTELAAATAAGEMERADNIHRELKVMLKRFDAALTATAAGGTPPPKVGPTQREVVIGIVAAIADATPARMIRDIAGVEGTPIKATGFPSMFRADEGSWKKNPRRKPVLLLPGLEAVTLTPMTSWVSLSSFPPAQRVITPLTPRAAHLRVLRYVLDRLAAGAGPASVESGLEGLARRWASPLPETRVFGDLDPTALQATVLGVLGEVAEAETRQRDEAARLVEQSPVETALFGFRGLERIEGRVEDVP
jgi:hypothetical protein